VNRVDASPSESICGHLTAQSVSEFRTMLIEALRASTPVGRRYFNVRGFGRGLILGSNLKYWDGNE